jgi:hypothetical protein
LDSPFSRKPLEDRCLTGKAACHRVVRLDRAEWVQIPFPAPVCSAKAPGSQGDFLWSGEKAQSLSRPQYVPAITGVFRGPNAVDQSTTKISICFPRTPRASVYRFGRPLSSSMAAASAGEVAPQAAQGVAGVAFDARRRCRVFARLIPHPCPPRGLPALGEESPGSVRSLKAWPCRGQDERLFGAGVAATHAVVDGFCAAEASGAVTRWDPT